MSPSEIAFLALGLILGSAGGAAFLAVARSRPGAGHAVRVTITPNAIGTRRARTLAEPDGARSHPAVPGSPDDDAGRDVRDTGASDGPAGAPWPAAPRTRVPSAPASLPASAVGIPIVRDPAPAGTRGLTDGIAGGGPAGGGPGLPAPLATRAERPTAVAVADRPIASAPGTGTAPQPFPATLDIGPSLPDLAVRPRPPVAVHLREQAPAVVAVAVVTVGADRPTALARRTRSAGDSATTPVAADPCADQRRLVAERCAAADRAREAATISASMLREVQRAHADLRDSVEAAGAQADPRHISAKKDRLHAEFRAAHERAAGHDEAETAAREWLTEISRLNAAVRDALNRVRAGTAELRARAAELERQTLAATADRIAAEIAEASCRDAREAVADCEERQVAARPAPAVDEPHPYDAHWPGSPEPTFDRAPDGTDLEGIPAIVRVLRGDDAAREQLVLSLAGQDRASVPGWHVRIARFVDAVVARAIEAGYLDLPGEEPFWHLFSRDERRGIVAALSALGYRFDGLRGFADGRVPTARDLSLAVGYAGLDPMRIRIWPRDPEIADLYGRAAVAADLWLAEQADDLALGRVIDALGPRAGDLTELWDAWGRVRPAFLLEV